MKKLLSILFIMSALCGSTCFAQTFENGAYYQLGSYNNQPIIWRCVINDNDENGILMVTDKILCYKAFDSSKGDEDISVYGNEPTTEQSERDKYGSEIWEESSIRAWLNSTESAGNVLWKRYSPKSEGLWKFYTDNFESQPYDQERGFLNEDNFSLSERSVMKSVAQWNAVTMDIRDRAKNGGYALYAPFYYYERGQNGTERLYEATLDDCHIAFSTAAVYRLTDTVFLLNEPQVHSVYEKLGMSETTLQDNHKIIWLRTPYTKLRGVITLEVYSDGYGYFHWKRPYEGKGAVRPAFYLNEETAYVTSGSGTADSPYIIDGTAQEGIAVFANGNQLNFMQQPIIENDHTLVGMRKIFESLGANVSWDGENQTVTAVKDNTVIKMQIDNNIIQVNGETMELDAPARLVNDNTMVPLRAVSETLDAKVEWIEDLQRIVIDISPEWIKYEWTPKELGI